MEAGGNQTARSQNKNNEKDAESVARYALALEAQGKLEQFSRVWYPDESLRLLTCGYERKSKELTAEIIDIRRFANDDRLASYSGLGRSEYSTGDRSKMVTNPQFNRRLKDIFMISARNFVRYTSCHRPDSRIPSMP